MYKNVLKGTGNVPDITPENAEEILFGKEF